MPVKKEYPEVFTAILEDARKEGAARISLVDLIWQYDGRMKLSPLLSELNTALGQIDWIDRVTETKEVFLTFVNRGSARVQISDDEFGWADKEYRKRFWRRLKTLNSERHNPN